MITALLAILIVIEAFRAIVEMGYLHKKQPGTTPITRKTVRANNDIRKPQTEDLIDLDQVEDPELMAQAMEDYMNGGAN